MKIEIKPIGPIRLAVNVDALSKATAGDMLRWWLANFRAGKQPDGAALPRNKEGAALGVGGGTLSQGWSVQPAGRVQGSASAAGVFQGPARHRTAIGVMMRRGVRFQGLDGASERKWSESVKRRAKSAIKLG